MKDYDLVVIGAGFHGLSMAKTYLEANPSSRLLILDSASSIGGVWASHRLYPGLKSNNMLGTYEFSDFPMDPKLFDVRRGEHIPGKVMHEYFSRYAEHFELLGRMRFGTKVESAEHRDEGGWSLKVVAGEKEEMIETKRLVVATGMTSEAFLPAFEGGEGFDAPLFHCRDFLDFESTLETAKGVVIFGGTKSAWDAVYAYAAKGTQVDWVIRESGHGPCWMAPPYVTPLKKWLEKLVHTRLLTWFSPCIWGDIDGYSSIRNFLHGTAIGRFIVDRFWWVLGNDVITLNKYDTHPETKKLKPWIDLFWIAAGLSILNFPTNIFDFVRNGQVKVHFADITSVSRKTVHLSNGTRLPTDALICATGWKHTPPVTFLPAGLDAKLGLPHKISVGETEAIKTLTDRADAEILTRFPRLKYQPNVNPNYKPLTEEKDDLTVQERESHLEPWRLYRFMVPPAFISTRDIAFSGALMTASTALIAQTQALWLTAFLGGPDVPSPRLISPLEGSSMSEIRYETVLHARFGKWRAPGGFGARFPDFVFDAVPYIDLLLKDLGLEIKRKGGGWFKEALEPYGQEDYRGLVREWLGGGEVTSNGGRKKHLE